jgi:hypothetical protein
MANKKNIFHGNKKNIFHGNKKTIFHGNKKYFPWQHKNWFEKLTLRPLAGDIFAVDFVDIVLIGAAHATEVRIALPDSEIAGALLGVALRLASAPQEPVLALGAAQTVLLAVVARRPAGTRLVARNARVVARGKVEHVRRGFVLFQLDLPVVQRPQAVLLLRFLTGGCGLLGRIVLVSEQLVQRSLTLHEAVDLREEGELLVTKLWAKYFAKICKVCELMGEYWQTAEICANIGELQNSVRILAYICKLVPISAEGFKAWCSNF